MKRIKFLVLCLAILSIFSFGLVGCGSTEYTVSFGSESTVSGTALCRIQDGGSVTTGTKVKEDTVLVFTATVNDGYKFEGWYAGNDKVSSSANYTVTLKSDISLVAKYSVLSYTLTFTPEDVAFGGVSSVDYSSGDSVAYGTSVTVSASVNQGYTFIGWYYGYEFLSAELEYTFDMPATDFDLIAKYATNSYAITFGANDAELGNVSCEIYVPDNDNTPITTGATIEYNKTLVLKATANVGYKFVGWYFNADTNPVSTDAEYSFQMTAGALTVEGRFDLDSFVLTYVSANTDRGTVSGSVTSGSPVQYKSSVTVTATEKTGYDFIGWFIPGEDDPISESAEYTFEMRENALSIEARFTPEERTITYWDGLVRLKTSKVDYGTPFDNYEPTRANKNYKFDGWCSNSTLTTKYNPNTPVTENIQLYASWEEIVPEYEIIFLDENGNEYNVQNIFENEGIYNIPGAPDKKVGYEFKGWYYDKDGVQTKLEAGTTVTGDMTFTPVYSILKYHVKFYKNDADYATSRAYIDLELDYGSKVTKPATPDPTETLVFSKWVDCDDKTLEFDFENTVVDVDINLIAVWVAKPVDNVTITFLVEKNGATHDTQVIEKGASAKLPSVPAVEGFDFVKWVYDDGTEEVEVTADTKFGANTTVYATYAIKSYKVTFKYDDGTVIDEQTVVYNQSATEPGVKTIEGYYFDGWDKDFTEVKEDLEIVAKYVIYTITVTFYNGNEVLGTQTIEYGSFATIPETPDVDGFTFAGWFSDNAFSEEFEFDNAITFSDAEREQGISVYAKLLENVTETYTVTFVVNNSPVSTQTVLHGGSAIVPANPSVEGFVFVKWVGEYTNVQSDLEIVAEFVKKEYTVKFFEADGTTLIGEFKVKYEDYANTYAEYQENIFPNIPVVEFKTFKGWDKNIESLKITKDTDFVAVYASDPITVTFKIDGQEDIVVTIDKGTCVNIPNTPSKAGYICKYWYLTDSTVPFAFDTVLTEDTLLNAYFEPIADVYVVTFIGVNNEQYKNVQVVKKGNKATEIGYDDGTITNTYIWCLDKDNPVAFDFNTAINESITLYAVLDN